jgi:hypothetical protein
MKVHDLSIKKIHKKEWIKIVEFAQPSKSFLDQSDQGLPNAFESR